MSGESCHMANPSSETSTIGEGGPTTDGVLGVGWGQGVGDPAAPPVDRPVIAGSVAVDSEGTLSGAACVDDVRVDLADVVDVDLEALAHIGQEAREKDVRALGQPVEQLAAGVTAYVEPDAPLAPVGLLHDVVDRVGAARDEAHRDQAALGVAGLGVLDLDHVRSPVGQDGPGGRDEGPGGDLEDPEALQCIGHGGILCSRAGWAGAGADGGISRGRCGRSPGAQAPELPTLRRSFARVPPFGAPSRAAERIEMSCPTARARREPTVHWSRPPRAVNGS
jgi:hypothetical protein